jgi:GntR family transcriptional regulator
MTEPMWRRIAEDLRQKIESGELGRDGMPLPSELKLRDLYDASRNTVRDAVKWLITRGLVVTRPGQGTFVRQKIDPFVTQLPAGFEAMSEGADTAYESAVTAHKRVPEISELRIEIHRAADSIMSELGLQGGETIVSRHQQRFIDGVPWSLQTTFYPMRLVEQGARLLLSTESILPGAVPYIEETLGFRRAGLRDKFKIRAPDRNETAFFGLPDDGRVAVMEITQTICDECGTPYAAIVATYPADRNEFMMSFGTASRAPGVTADQRAPDDVGPLAPGEAA